LMESSDRLGNAIRPRCLLVTVTDAFIKGDAEGLGLPAFHHV